MEKNLLDRIFPEDQLVLSDSEADSTICCNQQIPNTSLATDAEQGLEEED